MPTRRSVLQSVASACAIGLVPGTSNGQLLTPVKLLVVRKPAFSLSNVCVAPCIRGKIFDVSSMSTLDDMSDVFLGLLGNAVCDVIERPWKDNLPTVSSIPPGAYSASVRDDATKDWMNSVNRRWRLELSGVPHRTNIQFHYGEDVGWSEGCFIVGDLLQSDASTGILDTYCELSNAEAAIERLRGIVESNGGQQATVTIGVTDDYNLFPDFDTSPNC